MKYRICTVIINYRTVSLVKDCANSLKKQLDFNKDCIVIVDNHSGGNDCQQLLHWIDSDSDRAHIFLIDSPVNGGFSAGNNLGIRSVEASYYFLTNSDTVILNPAIDILLKAAQNNSSAGLIGPRLIWPNKKVQVSSFKYPRPICEIIDSTDNRFFTGLLHNYVVPEAPADTIKVSEWISFASILIRKEVFDSIGFMDEGYFMYYEDVDFCRRAAKQGYQSICVPEAKVIHLIGQSSGVDSKKSTRKRLPPYYYLSRSRYYRKYYGLMGLFVANLLWCLGRPVSFLAEYVFRREKKIPRAKLFDIWKRERRIKFNDH